LDAPATKPAQTELQRRLGALFRRKASTQWSPQELKALRAIKVSEDDLKRLEWYYRLQLPIKEDFRRRSLQTLLNNFPGELDRARRFKEPSDY
jgi:hypothetical protein